MISFTISQEISREHLISTTGTTTDQDMSQVFPSPAHHETDHLAWTRDTHPGLACVDWFLEAVHSDLQEPEEAFYCLLQVEKREEESVGL
ncbi:hypothetical protein E2C01_014449 [Portunus trituberculatus]|uniref:Uncharacterized protein n=1 Tax=Portunus trituberculatus TaxID=210409 RepID=A0A5B7DIV4_PORTR|nr:hypothetical protein [Portunus trituberculatus]